MFDEEDCWKIKNIPISMYGSKDRIVQPYIVSGEYSVKIGYMLAREIPKEKELAKQKVEESSRAKGNTGAWKFIWSLDIKHKLKHFIWKC